MTWSPVCLAILEQAISAVAVSNLTVTKANMLVAITQIIAQPVCKTSAPTTAKPKLTAAQPLFHATDVSENSLGRPVFYNTEASLTKAP